MSKLVVAHFDAYRKRTKFQFLWRISLEGLLVAVVLGIIADFLFRLPDRTDLDSMSNLQLLFAAVIFAPISETLLLQALPVMVARWFGLRFWGSVVASGLIFAVPHATSGLSTFICAGLIGGFYLGFTYVHWRETSLWSALWMTAVSHAAQNLVWCL